MYRPAALLVALAILAGAPWADANAQSPPKLLAKVYPGSVPQEVDNKGQPVRWKYVDGAGSGFQYLTRDSVEKVAAFYAQAGLKVERIKPGSPNVGGMVGPWQKGNDFADSVQSVSAAPVEFFREPQDTGGYTELLLGVALVTLKPKPALQGDSELNRQTVLDHPILIRIAVRPMGIYSAADNKAAVNSSRQAGQLQLDAGALIPFYNRHLPMLSGFYVRGVPEARLQELTKTRALGAYQAGSNDKAEKKSAQSLEDLDNELEAILERKPAKQNAYVAIQMKMADKMRKGDENAEKDADAEVDKLLLTDPELTAWKKKRDTAQRGLQDNRSKRDSQNESAKSDLVTDKSQMEAIERYLSVMDKEYHSTLIVINTAGGKWATNNPAKLQERWKAWQDSATVADSESKPRASAPASADPAKQPEKKDDSSTSDTLKEGADAGIKLFKKLF